MSAQQHSPDRGMISGDTGMSNEGSTFCGRYFDGHTAAAHPAAVRFGTSGLSIRVDRTAPVFWPFVELEMLPLAHADDWLSLRRTDDSPARLRLPPSCRALLELELSKYPRQSLRAGLYALARPMAALVLLLTCTLIFLPGFSSIVIGWRPPDIERRYAEASYGAYLAAIRDYEERAPRFCSDPQGLAALGIILKTLRGLRSESNDIHLTVMQSETANAFSFGGGYVVVLSGLIDLAESDTEVFSVLAHELGHDWARHPARMAMEAVTAAGIASVFFNTLTPDFVVAIAGANYSMPVRSRQMEREADGYAVEAMRQAGLDPAAGGDLMRRLSERDGDGYDFFSDHPSYAERTDMFLTASQPGAALLTPRQWRALKNICRQTETAPVSPPEPLSNG